MTISKHLIVFLSLFITQLLTGSVVRKEWTTTPFEQKVFIENKGQFDNIEGVNDKVLFATSQNGVEMLFTSSGVVYKYDKLKVEKTKTILNAKEGEKEEESEKLRKIRKTSLFLKMELVDAMPVTSILGENKIRSYF